MGISRSYNCSSVAPWILVFTSLLYFLAWVLWSCGTRSLDPLLIIAYRKDAGAFFSEAASPFVSVVNFSSHRWRFTMDLLQVVS